MMGFLKEVVPPRGEPLPVLPGVSRVVADNPSVMTYHGTNTYLIEDGQGGLTVLDPGPDMPAHIDAVAQAGAGRIRRIVVSHAHSDHFGGVAALVARTGAPTWGWHQSSDARFTPDHGLRDGDQVAGLHVLFTPGHAPDHICLEWHDGVVFTADHVMGWASSIVSPPQGDMAAYCHSLDLLLERPHQLYLCGHGPVIRNPALHVRNLLGHRMARERGIAQSIAARPEDPHSLMEALYSKVDPYLKMAAERNVLAHLMKLRSEGKAEERDGLWHWIGPQAP